MEEALKLCKECEAAIERKQFGNATSILASALEVGLGIGKEKKRKRKKRQFGNATSILASALQVGLGIRKENKRKRKREQFGSATSILAVLSSPTSPEKSHPKRDLLTQDAAGIRAGGARGG